MLYQLNYTHENSCSKFGDPVARKGDHLRGKILGEVSSFINFIKSPPKDSVLCEGKATILWGITYFSLECIASRLGSLDPYDL